jgi:Prokaryotic Cytochrome C oxidase subunit IV
MSGSVRNRRVTGIWLALIAATLISWTMGQGDSLGSTRRTSIAIIVIAFLKIRYVIYDFMDLRGAPLFMRIVAESWVLIVCTTIIAFYAF